MEILDLCIGFFGLCGRCNYSIKMIRIKIIYMVWFFIVNYDSDYVFVYN